MNRRVICAAIKSTERLIGGGYLVVLGVRHHDNHMNEHIGIYNDVFSDEMFHGAIQGFVDNFGVFMDRKEAWLVAEAAGQILYRVGGDGSDRNGLFSENLY